MKTKHPTAVRPDHANAFFPEPSSDVRARTTDAAHFGEEFVSSALTGESCTEDARDEVLDDEEGGGFHLLDEEEMALSVGGSGIDRDAPESVEGTLATEQATRGGRWVARGS